ncbi:intron-binding protein aquarius-like [Centruroides sculpturatus]|uniref:intron-binding protein aquarius-like n=1 Tax=Centruroides sculpturatus TaxID=218467 RepID=UPI000C6E66E3|nr:intron-binding protein aquarius-like [Centruroides sculpturatus]
MSTKDLALTVEQISTDPITKLADQYWAPHSASTWSEYDSNVVDDIYIQEILGSGYAIKRIMLLEFSQYLENYLWPNYNPEKASHLHMMSIVIMVNEKFRERVPAWSTFQKKPEHFPAFFRQVMERALSDDTEVSLKERMILVIFLIHCFNSVEVNLIREQIQRLVSLSMWICLLPERREHEFRSFPKFKKFWTVIKKNDSKLDEAALEKVNFERRFLSNLIKNFCGYLDSIPSKEEVPTLGKDVWEKIHYCERFLELMIDLEALLPTRRFFNVLLDDSHLVVKCRLSNIVKREEGRLFSQLLEMLQFYTRFEINDHTGEALTERNTLQIHYDRITALQRAVFKDFPELKQFALANVASIDSRSALKKHFSLLDKKRVQEIAAYLKLLPSPQTENNYDEEFLHEVLISRHERKTSQLEALNEMPLYPTETIIWDENVVPSEYFSGEGCLALPKLNLQFLTLHDYLLRNFHLFRLESTYEIRQDIEDSVSRLKPWKTEEGGFMFGGWARMAQPIVNFAIIEVGKPNIGEKQPSRVRADVTVNLNVRQEIKDEWEALRKHDVCFLITVVPPNPPGTPYNYKEPFIPQVGLTCVRGCEIEGMLDINGRVIEEGPEPKPNLPGDTRTFRVWLDCNQYRLDMDKNVQGKEDVYETFNIIMRRKPKENNFKAVLQTIRDLMNTECVVPEWLHDIILGYGDPDAAHYSNMDNLIQTLDFNDTFLDMDHLRDCFPNHQIDVKVNDPTKLVPPFKISFCGADKKHKSDEEETTKEEKPKICIIPHILPSRGPYPYEQPKKNTVRFTPTQVEAIRAGMQPGLTMVVGPPGTGKTDVAVQIISNLYHNFPEQRTLIVTHSNQALNQLFEKIMALDVDERHLLRLGHGEEALETEKDFSRYGRVNFVLAKRLDLLNEVDRLQKSLGAPGDVAHTCETAGYFFLYHILSRWEEYLSKVKPRHGKKVSLQEVSELFPFTNFFENAPQPLFTGESYEKDFGIAEGCFRYIKKIFTQLEEFRAFELLRSGLDRSRYLLVKEAKIIAMTCTHAALKRQELVELGFKYDNILMEESAQILEIETFIPLLLQNPENHYNRLKRWIMIGDHHQLPPVIKNMAFQKYSNMEQSLFTRFVRLGVPTVELDAQGRSRPSICNLYNWRYNNLGNLPHVLSWTEYRIANAGFHFDYQLVNVEDFNGIGESEPNPYFYQNLAEAEYVVAVFMYMRLLGYPADKITILTTYNGQKHLIRDVINQRAANNYLIGRPRRITTVDKYQGQQNDYILLSLVRTKAVGHLRDVRRLVVAMSRARLGLYIFARVALFQNCFELTPTFNLLMKRPLELHLAPYENYPTARSDESVPLGDPLVIKDMPQMVRFIYEFYQQKIELMTAEIRAQKSALGQTSIVNEVSNMTEETQEKIQEETQEEMQEETQEEMQEETQEEMQEETQEKMQEETHEKMQEENQDEDSS